MNQFTRHIISRRILATIMVVAVGASTALAQTKKVDGAMAPGQRVRVTAASTSFTGVLVGNVVKVGAESLTVIDPKGGALTELPLNSITRVEAGHQRRGTKKGLLIGLGIGSLLAGVVAASNADNCFDNFASGSSTVTVSRQCTSSEKVTLAAGALIGGAGIGAWVGHSKRKDTWSDVAIRDSMSSSSDFAWQLSPTFSREGGGAGLRLRLTW